MLFDGALAAPFLLMYPAVVLAAWLGSWQAAAMVLLVSVVVIPYYVLPPPGTFHIQAARDAVELGIFCVLSGLIVTLLVRMRRALEAAAEATAARDAMVAIVAHDLRNPLETIGLNAELLAADVGDEHVRARLTRISRAAERAHRLVEGNLDSARGQDLFPLHRDVYPVAQLIDDVVGSFENLTGRATIRLDTSVPDGVSGTLFCDRDRMAQALTNIVANAVALTPPERDVTVRVRREPDAVRFEVEDSGPRLTSEQIAHMFDQHWSGRPGVGSGLGMWVTKAIVDAHGGSISVRGAPNEGNTVSVVLPQPSRPTIASVVAKPVPA